MTTMIEMTRRAMYECLDRVRRAAKHRTLTAEFEERLEEHLEQCRLAAVYDGDRELMHQAVLDGYERQQQLTRNALADNRIQNDALRQLTNDLLQLQKQHAEVQQRLHAIDSAYAKSQEALGIAGSEIRSLKSEIKETQQDVVNAENFSEQMRSKCDDLQCVLKRQREAYRELFQQKSEGRILGSVRIHKSNGEVIGLHAR